MPSIIEKVNAHKLAAEDTPTVKVPVLDGVQIMEKAYNDLLGIEKKMRRERIATAALQGILGSQLLVNSDGAAVACDAVHYADALIAALDR